MKSILSNTCTSAALCAMVLVDLPAIAAGVGNTPGGGVGAGATTGVGGTSVGTGINTTGQVTTPAGALNSNAQANAEAAVALSNNNRVGGSVSTGGMTDTGDLDSATAGNNAGSVDMQAQTPARRMAHRAQANADDAAEGYNGQRDNGPQGATITTGTKSR